MIHAFAWVLMLSSAALSLVTLLSAADPHALRFLHLHRIINPGNVVSRFLFLFINTRLGNNCLELAGQLNHSTTGTPRA